MTQQLIVCILILYFSFEKQKFVFSYEFQVHIIFENSKNQIYIDFIIEKKNGLVNHPVYNI